MIDPTTGKEVPIKCIHPNCKKFDRCMLKFRMDGCEFYNDFTCYDCIYHQTDEYDGTIFCTENKATRLISDPWGQGEITICKKFRRSNHG